MSSHIEWSDAMIHRLGTDTDVALGSEWGISHVSVSMKRRSLNIPVFGRPVKNLTLDSELMGKINQLAPILAANLRERGIPLTNLEPWQVIEIAVNDLYSRTKKEQTRKKYISSRAVEADESSG